MTHPLSNCPDCGTALPDDSPQQLCPSCLLKQAFASRTVDQAPTEPSPPPSPEEIADRFPQFEITECLGRGGMGVVYKARQKSLNRWVAIKVLAPERIHDEKFAERFAREAQTLAQLNHPNIVTVHDYGETDGLYFIVMEFVDGVNLRDLLRDGKIEATQALTIVPPICEALQYAHDKGIVHRDIKPENLLIDREGRVKIADFGIASLVGATGEQSGTPPYMAPEQGAHTHVDHRADIYALGAVLYEMLTGDRPAAPLDLPSQKVQLDIRIDDIVLRALNKEPERRYRTANEFRTVVETVSNDATSKKSSPQPPLVASSPSSPIQKRGMFRRWWWIMLSFVLVGPAIGIFGSILIADLSPKKFETTSIVQVGPKDSIGGASTPHDQVFSELLSAKNLSQVAERHELSKRWELSDSDVIPQLRKSIQLSPLRGTDLIEIRVQATNSSLAQLIANSLPEIAAKNSSSSRILIHQQANRPKTPVVRLRKWILIGAPVGLLLSPLLALAIMALLQGLIPDRNPDAGTREFSQDQKIRHAFYGKIALGLFLAGTLGTLAMMTLSHRHDMALIFGGVALLLSLVFGLMSRRRGVILALIAIAIIAVILTVISAFIFYFRMGSVESSAAKEELRARESALVAESTARNPDARSKPRKQASGDLSFGPTRIHNITAPTKSDLNCFLDLDTGKLISASPEIYPLVKHRFNAAVPKPLDVDNRIGAWARETGADLMICMTDPALHFALYSGIMDYTTPPFEEVTPTEVMKEVTMKPSPESEGRIPPPFISFSSPDSDSNQAVAFRTREGAVGVMTVLRSSRSSKHVAVSFKLVENSKGPVRMPSREFEHIAVEFLIAIRDLEIEAAHALLLDTAYEQLSPQNELTDKKRAQMLTDFKEMNQAYGKDPSLMLTVTEWHGNGGYTIGRVSPPKGGDGGSLCLVLALSPKGWRINDVNDIRSDERLAEKLDQWLKEN